MQHPSLIILNIKLRRFEAKVEWRPKLQVFDAFRFRDAMHPRWNMRAFMTSTPKLRTPDFFEACCFAMSPHHRKVVKP